MRDLYSQWENSHPVFKHSLHSSVPADQGYTSFNSVSRKSSVSYFVWFSWNTRHFHVILQCKNIADLCWKFEQQDDKFVNLSIDGHFLQQHQHAVLKLVIIKFQASKICHPVVWIVLHRHKLVNPDFVSWHSNFVKSAFAEMYIPCFLRIFRGRVLIFTRFWGISEKRKRNFYLRHCYR